MEKIKFNNSCKSTHFTDYIELLQSDYDLLRQKHFSNHCINAFSSTYPSSKLFLTHSATGALEMIADLMEIKPGDEIILPSFTFVSSANAFVSRGATPVFVDIDESSLSLTISAISAAISPNTKAVLLVHYFGHSTNVAEIKDLCKANKLLFIEDAAMGYGSSFESQPLGVFGDFGVVSFDVTKHISAIQGGLLLVNNEFYAQRAALLYHNGTNREEYQGGNVPYYEWVDFGSKYQMNELNAAFLWSQLQVQDELFIHRKKCSQRYYEALFPLQEAGHIQLMDKRFVSENIHGFYIILATHAQREELRTYLLSNGIEALFHYIPLHLSKKAMELTGAISLPTTEKIAGTLLRLPFHDLITAKEIKIISTFIHSFFNEK